MEPMPPLDFIFTKAKFTSKEIVLDEYEICRKMLEQIFKNLSAFGASGALPPLKVLDLPLFSVSHCCKLQI